MSIADDFRRASHLAALSNHELISRLKSWVTRERHVTLGVLLLLNEVESRKLHLDRYASLFAYCTDRLGYSHSAAGRRIAAARCLRKFPEIVPMLADGRLNLTTLCILARVLTPKNSAELLARATGASQDEAERLAAEFGKPRPARDRIRPVKPVRPGARSSENTGSRDGQGADRAHSTSQSEPAARRQHPGEATQGNGFESAESSQQTGARGTSFWSETSGTSGPAGSTGSSGTSASAGSTGSSGTSSAAERLGATVEAIDGGTEGSRSESTSRARATLEEPMYDIIFRGNAQLVAKLRRAQDLLSSANPNPSLALVVDQALELWLDRHDPIRRQARRDARAADRTGHMNARKNSARPRNGTAPINNTAPRNDPAPMHSTAPTNSIATTHSAAPMNDSRVGAAEVTAGKSMGRRMIPQAVRDSVLHAYGNRCAHVGSEGRCPETRNLDVDHIVPVAMGGTDEPDNLRPACRGHNQRFADLSFGRDLMNKHRQGTRKTTSVVRETSTPAPGVIARCARRSAPAAGAMDSVLGRALLVARK